MEKLLNDIGITTIAGLRFRSSPFEPCFDRAVDRMFHAAAFLPEGNMLGWQCSCTQDGVTMQALGSAAVGSADLIWIFDQAAELCFPPDGTLTGTGPDIPEQQLYTLSPSGAAVQEAASAVGGKNDFAALFSLICELRGAIVLLTAPDGHGGIRSGIFLLLSTQPDLRLRTALALAFHDTTLALSDAAHGPQLAFDRSHGHVAACCTEAAMHCIARMCPPEPDEEVLAFYDEEDFSDGRMPIEALQLSVRSFNCLKRAGINYVDELRGVSMQQLLRIRNMGRKSAQEIMRKLTHLDGVFGPGATDDSTSLEATEPAPEAAPVPRKDHAAALDQLIGLQEAKAQVRRVTALARMQKDRRDLGLDTSSITLNMEFVGNPGTAKTTVARIVAGILQDVGLLSGGELVEVGRADLVARYEGQTADQVKQIFQKAKGNVLFIDEAYALVENWSGAFGDEAINAIVQEMENHREDTVVIFAGYPREMDDFFRRNPGLKSRVPFRIDFKDYSTEEMMEIAALEAEKQGFTISPDAADALSTMCAKAVGDPNAGNGRFSRNLVENAILSYAERVYGDPAQDVSDRSFTLLGADFSAIPVVLPEKTRSLRIGFDAGLTAAQARQ